jgi:hypothetical protein
MKFHWIEYDETTSEEILSHSPPLEVLPHTHTYLNITGPPLDRAAQHHLALVQTSFSMTTLDRIAIARQAILRLVDTLTAQDFFSLVTFRDTATLAIHKIRTDRKGRAEIHRLLRIPALSNTKILRCRGKANPSRGVHRAFSTLAKTKKSSTENHQDVIHFMSDGWFTTVTPHTIRKIVERFVKEHPTRVDVYPIGIGAYTDNLRDIVPTFHELRSQKEVDEHWPIRNRRLQLATCLRLTSIPDGCVTMYHREYPNCIPYRDGSLAVPIGALEEGEEKKVRIDVHTTDASNKHVDISPKIRVDTYVAGVLSETGHLDFNDTSCYVEDAQGVSTA